MAASIGRRRHHALLRIAVGLGLLVAALLLVGLLLKPVLGVLAVIAANVPTWLAYICYGLAGVVGLVVAGIAMAGFAYISLGIYELFEDVHRKAPLRPAREQAIGDFILGGVLAIGTLVAAVVWSGERWWGFGVAATASLTVSVGVLTICRGVANVLRAPSVAFGVSAMVLGVLLSVVGVAYVPVTSTPYRLVAYAVIIIGLASITEGIERLFALRPPRATRIALAPMTSDAGPVRRRVIGRDVAIGCGFVVVGLVMTFVNSQRASISDGDYVLGYGPIGAGAFLLARALMGGFKSFVAWRYLLVFEIQVTRRLWISLAVAAVAGAYAVLSWQDLLGPFGVSNSALLGTSILGFGRVAWAWGLARHAKLAFVVLIAALLILLGALIANDVLTASVPPRMPDDFLVEDPTVRARASVTIIALIAGAIVGLALYVGTLRAFFTFFTTVPIVGVWIGTAALVCVLAVMSGFETDLRDKILGSNAHIQITREDGAFTNWREVKARVDKIPGVVASTPYAVSEVVIAAHNNGMNVIIKGIDPETVGKVTDLISDLEDRDAIKRLEPKVDDTERVVPQTPHTTGPDVVDPPPDDMPTGGDPIDFSAPKNAPDTDLGSAAEPPPLPPVPPPGDTLMLAPPVAQEPPAGDEPPAADEPYGGDAADLVAAPADALDPAPSDLLTSDEPPVDYSKAGGAEEPAIGVVDFPMESAISKRVESLPGVLVGRELVKQTHLYTGEEVRVVSPLSDPSNPDATGTPIPFNRDFRVAGVFFTGMYEYDLKYVYVTLDALQDFLDRGDEIDGIEVRIDNADDTYRFVGSETHPGLIAAALGPGYRVADWRELNRSLFSALKLEKIGMFIVLGIVILVASFSIVGNLIMVVVEKAREIALLKTLGASDFSVTQLFAIQGLMIGLIGTILGVATGLLACWAGKTYGIPLNPDVYYIDRLPVHVDATSVAAAALAGVVISILATLYPALLAARVRPAAGMRH